jgi:hypothetical protein
MPQDKLREGSDDSRRSFVALLVRMTLNALQDDKGRLPGTALNPRQSGLSRIR